MEIGGSGVDPDRLKAFGKRAADLHSEGASLTEAVVKVVRDAGLNASHVRRVCEFANQDAYSRAWDKGGDVRNVQFRGGPADPADVVKATNAKASPKKDLSDYDKGPSKRGDDLNDLLKVMFAGKTEARPQTKTASDHRASIFSDLRRADEHFAEKLGSLKIRLHDAGALLQASVREAFAMDGYPMDKIAMVFRAINPAYAGEAMDLVLPAVAPLRLSAGTATKTAGAIPNPDHPLVLRYRELCKVAQATRIALEAKARIGEEIAALEGAH